jgi:parallel beta-helix repeat protein
MIAMNCKFVAAILIFSLVNASLLIGVNPAISQLSNEFYIQSDGSVIGTNNIQRIGNVYTFSGNIAGSLVVEKDNIVIDGAGYLLQSPRHNGIDLSDRVNVTIKNTKITQETGNCLNLRNTLNCLIQNNAIFGSPRTSSLSPSWWAGPIAIEISHSSNNTFKDNNFSSCFSAFSARNSDSNLFLDNNIVDCREGIQLQNVTDCTFRNNHLSNSSFILRASSEYGFNNDIDTSNTIDEQPIIYWINEKNQVVPDDAAFVALINCFNITAKNITPLSILCVLTTNSSLTDIKIADTWGSGIDLIHCSNVIILNSNISDRGNLGISLDNSSKVTISNCTIKKCANHGIELINSSNNLITKNTFTSNGNAITSNGDSKRNNITENIFTANQVACHISNDNTAVVSNNTYTGNKEGVQLRNCSVDLTENVFKNNELAISIAGSNNLLKNNRLENNTKNLSFPEFATQFHGYLHTVDVIHNDVDMSNTIDGRPIIYWINQYNKIVPPDASLVLLMSCTNITAQDLYLTGNEQGLVVIDTQNSTINGNTIITNTLGVGIFKSYNNIFSENYIAKNMVGMRIDNSENNLIVNNSFIENKGTSNGFAIIFTGNQKDNTIIRNDFIDSRVIPMLQISINKFDGPGWGNIWNDSTSGNYWSDYQTRYQNSSEIDNTGIGNTPFVINENNIDYKPILQPLNQATPLPSPSPTIPASPTISPQITPSPSLSAPTPSNTTTQPEPSITTIITIILATLSIVIAGAFLLRKKYTKL